MTRAVDRGVTLADKIAAADAIEKLGTGIEEDGTVEGAPLIEVLFWGLHAGDRDFYGVHASMLRSIRDDLDVTIGFVAWMRSNDDVANDDIERALDRLKRRLDVVCELLTVVDHPKWAATQHPWVREAAREGSPGG